MKRRGLLFPLLLGLLFGQLAACSRTREPSAAASLAGQICSQALQGHARALLQAGRAVVVKPLADLCSRPPCAGALTDQALFGDLVKVLPTPPAECPQANTAFLQIETGSGYRGFTQIEALRPLAPGEPAYHDGGPLVRVTSRLANVYAQTDVTKGRPLAQLPVDLRLRLIDAVDKRWLKVRLPGGDEGYIQRGDVEELGALSPPSSACVIEHARLHLGTPYLWGGRSTLGIDCSGLVSNAFIACGVVPPRDASPQFGWSQLVPLPLSVEKLTAGDLLFFGNLKKDAPPKVTHVGIYVGDGRFIHATTHERPVVQESALADPHWTEIWVGARRYPFP
jgi:hypothetical protein